MDEGKVISFYRNNPFEGLGPLELARLATFAELCGDNPPHKVRVLQWRHMLEVIEAKRVVTRFRSEHD